MDFNYQFLVVMRVYWNENYEFSELMMFLVSYYLGSVMTN